MRAGETRVATRLAISACALMIVHYVLLDWAGRAGLLGLGATVWYIAASLAALRVTLCCQSDFAAGALVNGTRANRRNAVRYLAADSVI